MTDGAKKILIVEDEPSMLQVLSDALRAEKFDVVTASDGVEGLRQAETHHPDLILLDIVMPKMDGVSMMKKLRSENDWGKNVPIIILTNLSADDEILKSVTVSEPAYYLIKTNWTITDVIIKVKERLGM